MANCIKLEEIKQAHYFMVQSKTFCLLVKNYWKIVYFKQISLLFFFSPSCAKVGEINTSEILLFSLGKMHKATDLGNTSCLPCFEKLLMINFSVFIDQILVKITEAKSNISR